MTTDFIRYEPRFIEDSLLFALHGHEREREFQRERNRLYGIIDPEERERAFQKLDQQWFTRLGLTGPIERALSEEPLLLSKLGCCLVASAPGRRDEGAELFVNGERNGGKILTACIFLRPQSLLDQARLLALLRHELLHIVDMVDPTFDYQPSLPAAEGGPAHDRLLRDRYRILWDATIDGRMLRRGWAPEPIRAERLAQFSRAFPMFGQQAEQLFSHFFDREPHTHGELAAFASNPTVALDASGRGPCPGSRCALCGFPTYSFEPEPDSLPTEALAKIAQDFPRWHPSHGLCAQCAELYRAHSISTRAATSLPGRYSTPL
jgi:hypothetical protein